MQIQDFIDEISKIVVNYNHDITFFIGTGFSMWYGYPSWKGLFSNYCTKVYAEEEKHYDFLNELRQKVNEEGYDIPKAFDKVIEKFAFSREHVKNYIVDLFDEIDRIGKRDKLKLHGVDTEKYIELFHLSKKHKLITTNYDTLLEDMFESISGNKPVVYYTCSKDLNKQFFNQKENRNAILKLHGDINEKNTMIITDNDYKKFMTDSNYNVIKECLKTTFRDSITIFIGYSLNDVNIRKLLKENNEIFGNDKEKTYIFNLEPIFGDYELTSQQQRTAYDDLGVAEILISHFDELLAVLRHLNKLEQAKDISLAEAVEDFHIQAVTKEFKVWRQFKYAIHLCKIQCFMPAQKILGDVINEYKHDYVTKWDLIYSLYGVLLNCNSDAEKIKKGEQYLNKAIEISSDKDCTYSNIGSFFLLRSTIILYNSYSSNRLGIFIYKPDISKKALLYLHKAKKKDKTVKYLIVDAEQKTGNIKKALELAEKYKKEGDYHPRIDLVLAFIYFNKANEFRTLDNTEGKKAAFKKAEEFFKTYIQSTEYEKEVKDSKSKILDSYIQCLIESDQYDKAKDYCDELLKIDPSSDNVHRHLILIHINNRDFDKAIEECDYEISHTKDVARNLSKIKYIKAQCIHANAIFVHEVLEAIDICKEILKENDYLDVTFSIGAMYQSIGMFREMKEYYLKACYIYPLDESVFEIAMNLLSGHLVGEELEYDVKESMNEMAKLLKYKNDFKENRNVRLSDIYLYNHLDLRGNNKFKKLYVIDKVYLSEFLQLGRLNWQPNEDEKDDIDKAFRYYNIGQYEKTTELLLKYKDDFWDNHIFRYVYVNSIFLNGDIDKAFDEYNKIIHCDLPKYNDARLKIIYYYYGECFFYKKDYLKAEEYYNLAYSIDNEFLNALFQLGRAKFDRSYEGNGFYNTITLKEAKKCFEKYITLDPYNWSAYANLSRLDFILCDISGVIRSSIKLRGFIIPYEIKIENLNRLIFLYLIMKDDKNAKKYIKEADEFIDSAGISQYHKELLSRYYNLKGVYLSNYSFCDAKDCFEKAYNINPTEQNKKSYSINSKPGATHILTYGNIEIIRGGAN